MKKYLIKGLIDLFYTIASSLFLYKMLTSYVDDGNIFAIYLRDNNTLVIGDFWTALISVSLFIFFIYSILGVYKNVLSIYNFRSKK